MRNISRNPALVAALIGLTALPPTLASAAGPTPWYQQRAITAKTSSKPEVSVAYEVTAGVTRPVVPWYLQDSRRHAPVAPAIDSALEGAELYAGTGKYDRWSSQAPGPWYRLYQ